MNTVYRQEFILERVRNKKVLSIGLGGQLKDTSYSFNLKKVSDVSYTISARMALLAREIDFIDISTDAIELFSRSIKARFYNLDVTSGTPTWPDTLTHERYDVIVLGEVLEHVDCPGLALRNLSTLLTEDGEFVITVPNAFFISGVIKAMLGKEYIHPEHVCYYSPMTLTRLLNMSGLEAHYIAWSRWSRFDFHWIIHRLSHVIAHLAALMFPSLSEGVAAVAKLSQSSTKHESV